MTLNELFARFDKLAAVRVLRLWGTASVWQPRGLGTDGVSSEGGGPGRVGKRVR